MAKFYKSKIYKRFDKKKVDSQSSKWEDQQVDKPQSEGRQDFTLSNKASFQLRSKSVTLKADPYQAILPTASDYPIQARFLRRIDGIYEGEANLDAGNAQQYNYSYASKWLHAFDYIYCKSVASYGMTPVDGENDAPGTALIDERRKVYSEAQSILDSTAYRNLEINNYAIETSLNMGSAETTTVSYNGSNVQLYTNRYDVLYAMGMFYQIFWQEVHVAITAKNSYNFKQGTMIRNSFNRETAQLNSLFSNVNKAAFTNIVKTLAAEFRGEYIDRDFVRTLQSVTITPSRRSNSIFDPLIEFYADIKQIETFKVYILDASGQVVGDPIDFVAALSTIPTGKTDPMSLSQIVQALEDLFSAEKTAKWARNQNIYNPKTTQARFNEMKYLIDAINTIVTTVKPMFSDLRTAYDTLARAGIIRWEKGYVPLVTTDTDNFLFNNGIVTDILKNAISGNASVTYNTITKRWISYTMWDMYDGIPEYDQRSGGAFLTFSFKDISGPDDDDKVIRYLPRLFTGGVSGDLVCLMCDRTGHEFQVQRSAASAAGSANVVSLSRLFPLASQNNLKITMPQVDVSAYTPNTGEYNVGAVAVGSMAMKCLCNVVKYAGVKTTSSGSYVVNCDPDLLSAYQVEINDITNEAQTYARGHCAIKGTTEESIFGFNTRAISKEY